MSNAHTSYKLDEAQAIMNELRTIKKAICTGEKERRDLMQVRGHCPRAMLSLKQLPVARAVLAVPRLVAMSL